MRHSKEQKKNPDLSSEVLADNGTDQGHIKKLNRYGAAKLHQQAVADYILKHEPTLIKEYESLIDCGSWLVFRHWFTVNQYRLIAGCSCKKHLLCGLCALRRAARLVREYEKKILQVLSENPGLVPVLITRTVRNGPDLGERYQHLTSSHRKMIHKRRNALSSKSSARGKKTILHFVHGSAGSYEFKLGENSKEWHPHSHEIALLDGDFKFTDIHRKGKDVSVPLDFESELIHEWLKTTGDSFVVDVRRIDAKDEESFLKAICEAFKYALKFNSLEIPDQIHAYKTLKGRRLTFSYGSLWGVKVPDEAIDTIEEELKLLPYVDLVYTFLSQDKSGCYVLSEVTDLGELEHKKDDENRKSRRKAQRAMGHIMKDGSMYDEKYMQNFIEENPVDEAIPF